MCDDWMDVFQGKNYLEDLILNSAQFSIHKSLVKVNNHLNHKLSCEKHIETFDLLVLL